MKKAFIIFLIRNDCYYQFKNNYESDDNKLFRDEEIDTFEDFIESQDNYPFQFIRAGFEWYNTDQGEYYWDKIDDKWNEIINSL